MLSNYLTLSVILFSIGIVGILSRKNIIIIYMSIELLLNAINISLVAISNTLQSNEAQVIALMIIAIAAAEAALFMALFVVLFRSKRSLDADIFNLLGEKNAS